MSTFNDYPLNLEYGEGCFRRHIRLRASESEVLAELEDHHHAFRLTLQHDGQQLTAIHAETLRIPFSTCPGAVEPLQALRGLPISDDSDLLIANSNPTANCTHLYDLALLAIAQAARGPGERNYEIRIDDEQGDAPNAAEICVDGELVHRWLCRDWVIQAPEALAGNVLFKGFTKWAGTTFSGDAKRAAFALQKGYFVASARRYNLNAIAGEAANDARDYMYGACYTYTSPQIEKAVRLPDTVFDFNRAPEQLLRFRDKL